MTVTPETVITFAALVAAIIAIMKYYNKVYDLAVNEKKQDRDILSIKSELAMMTRGQLACLKGLKELGCNDVVDGSIREFEDYLNKAAHGQS